MVDVVYDKGNLRRHQKMKNKKDMTGKELGYEPKCNTQYGFKSYDEVMDYLKSGGIIGDFFGKEGEEDLSNNFLVMDNETGHVKFHKEMREDFSVFGEMKTRIYTPQEMRSWVESLLKYRTEDGFIPTWFFHKNYNWNAKDIKEMNIII